MVLQTLTSSKAKLFPLVCPIGSNLGQPVQINTELWTFTVALHIACLA